MIADYYAAAETGDLDRLVACFTSEAHVRDEGRDYVGAAEIRGWRESLVSQFTYTTEIVAAEQTGDGAFVVSTHHEGDFPGGVVDLTPRFTLSGGLISDLTI